MYVALIGGVAVLLGVSFYILTQPSALDAFDNMPVSSSQLASLHQASLPPYASGGSTLATGVRATGGQPFTSSGAPIIVYVGEDGCPYCAELRWPLVLSLMRFGNFTNLNYMTSSLDATDFPTFTFHGSSYQSKYIVFRPYEMYNRAGGGLDSPPSNVSTVFTSQGKGGFPFMNFNNEYFVEGALINQGCQISCLSNLFGNKTWTQVISGLGNSNDQLGSIILQGANVITSTICKATGGLPAAVCQQGPVASLASFTPGSSGASLNLYTVSPGPSVAALARTREL